MMVGAYVNFFFLNLLMALSGGFNGWIFLLAFIGSVIFAVLFGIIMDFIINKPLKGEPVFSIIMATISLAIILRSLTAILAGPLSIIPISPFGDQTFFLNGVVISILDISIIFSAIIIVVPLITPLGLYFGIDPVHLAIIFIANLELGFLTPPVGMNLFLSSYRFNKPMPIIYKSTLPFFIVMLISVILITYLPILSIWPGK